jgi:hypothetical protein
MRRFFTFFFTVASFIAASFPAQVLALAPLLPTCTNLGNCTTCDFLVLFINWAELIMYGLSAIAVLMIAIGGFMWILSAGNPEQVQKGRQMMIGAIVGVLFAFMGYLIVNLTIAAVLGNTGLEEESQLFGTDWSSFCESGLTPGGAVTDCGATGIGDGARCATTSCSEEGVCVCYNGGCIDSCTYAVNSLTEQGFTSSATCEADEDDCADGAESYPGYCTGGQVCCITTTTAE